MARAATPAEQRKTKRLVEALRSLVNGIDDQRVDGNLVADGQRAFDSIRKEYGTDTLTLRRLADGKPAQ